MRIIPAIDIIEGKCVRLSKGDFSQKTIYNENPAEVARRFYQAGIQFLHVVDLDGAKTGKITNWKTVEEVVTNSGLTVDFGGGIRTSDDISRLLDLGISQVNIGSLAVKDPRQFKDWLKSFGGDRLILSVDIEKDSVAAEGWRSTSGKNPVSFIGEFMEGGLRYVTSTDISRDGMLTGPNTDLYRRLVKAFPSLKVVASGGVSSIEDVKALEPTGVDGVIIGKAIYEGKIELEHLTN